MEKVVETNNKGVQYFLNKDFDNAEEEYKKALEIDGSNTTTLNNLGLLYHQKKQYDEAAEYFKKAISLVEKDTYYLNLANAQVFLQQMDEAELNYKKSIHINNENINAHISLARFYEAQKRINQSCEIWLFLSEKYTDDSYKFELGKNYMALQKFEMALSVFQELATRNQSFEVYCYSGICEFNMKNYGLAEEAFKKSLAEKPDSFKARHYLAINYLSKGEYNKAIREFDFLIKLYPENVKVKLDKVSILLNLKMNDEANAIIDEVLKMEPENEKALKYKTFLNDQNKSN